MSTPDVTDPYEPPVPLPPRERFAPGTLLADRYRIVAPLGRGGMGEVYRADDLTLGQPVALKFLPAHIAADADRLTRFRKEVAVARKVSHPNVCRVYDIAEWRADGREAPGSFLTMEFIDGEDLSSVLKRLGRVPEEKGVEIARQLCGALAAVHDQGLLHRDMKPANVMLDGRGQVRLTDFGLAAAAEDLSVSEVRSGTPLYQAPEQAAGKEVTVRSDLFALGLVLYELFTGRRAFADTKRDTPPSKPSSHVSNLNPAVERVILRCLEADPANRPRSAMEVLRGFPGGDPLAAALAAGETPSPELVADAGEVGLIRPWIGAALLAGLLLALFVFALLYSEVMLFAKSGGLPRSTEWLSRKARGVLDLAGVPEGHAAVGYDLDHQLWRWIEATDTSPDRWDRLTQPPAAPILFWYRESPRRLVPGLFYAYSGSVETTLLTWTDPPPTVAGMTGVLLDADGLLRLFYAVPWESAEPAGQSPNWKEWFGKAGLNPEAFESTTDHRWVPPVYADAPFTWVPRNPADPTLPARVEAGTHRGRVVWFSVTPVWLIPASGELGARPASTGTQGIGDQGSAGGLPVVYIPLVIAVIVLAPVTLRSGRADRRGSFLLGVGVFTIMMLVWGLETQHVLGSEEVRLFVLGVAAALYWAALVGFSYLVLEPYVRRWWPQTVISWNRLLAGRWRDPLVGRDLLIGVLAGVLWGVCEQLANQVPRWAGEPAPSPWWDWWVANTQVPGLWLGNLLINLAYSFRSGFFYCLLFLLLLRAVLRRPWLAGLAFVAITSTTQAHDYGFWSPSVGWVFIVLGQLLLLATLVRFGVLSIIVWYFVTNTLWFPMTTDPTRDYFVSGFLALGVILGLAAYGFYTATGGLSGVRLFAND